MHPFAKRVSESVASLGEERLIAAIRRWLGSTSPKSPFGIGDDCAVLPASRGPQLITVDPVIYPRHFNDTMSPRAAGEKLLKRNLSDLAAMGGRPTAAVLALTLSPRTRLDWLEQFYRSLAAQARAYRVPIVGGDISEGDPSALAASLTLLGEATGPRVVTRTGARRGDVIFVTGVLGGSLASGHHYGFTPRLKEGTWLARRSEVRAMMDISDGLAKDLHALTPRGTIPALNPGAIPCRAGCDLRSALTDGEDYELVVAVYGSANISRFTAAWRRAFPRIMLTQIGRFVTPRRLPAGSVDLSTYRGYEHLRSTP